MKPDMKNQPARNKCTKSTSGVTKTIDKNSKSKSKISAQSMKKVSIDKLSTQGNFNGLSEYEDTTDLTYDGKCGVSFILKPMNTKLKLTNRKYKQNRAQVIMVQ